jgi:hypothetical protein
VNGQIVGAITGAWIVVVLALKYGVPGWTKVDKFCLGSVIIGLGLWGVFDNPVISIVVNCGAGLIGSIPTIMTAWKDPSQENKLAWTIFFASCVCAIVAIPHWTPADAAQPITFFTIETIMMYVLWIRPRSIPS